MFKSIEKWQYPIGRYLPKQNFTSQEIEEAIKVLASFPEKLSKEINLCSPKDLNTPYREGGWTIRQLTHHIADSHMHAYIRCKFAYLEDRPLIKNYQEQDWAEKSPDACNASVEASLNIIQGVHERWVFFITSLNTEELNRTYIHPERTAEFPLAEVACFYAWHAQHHLAHIQTFLNYTA